MKKTPESEPKAQNCTLSIHAVPGAKVSSVAGLYGESIRVKIHAPPVDGKANEELIRFLAETLEVKERNLAIVKGETGREKVISIAGMTVADARKKLGV